jgi:hypothetical protein
MGFSLQWGFGTQTFGRVKEETIKGVPLCKIQPCEEEVGKTLINAAQAQAAIFAKLTAHTTSQHKLRIKVNKK